MGLGLAVVATATIASSPLEQCLDQALIWEARAEQCRIHLRSCRTRLDARLLPVANPVPEESESFWMLGTAGVLLGVMAGIGVGFLLSK